MEDFKDFIRNGMLITFEGGDGAGKGTQIKMLTKYFDEIGVDYIVSREPGGTKFAENLRKVLLESDEKFNVQTEFLLFSAARADHVEKVIKPAIEANKVVILDRYFHSSYAYQGFAYKGPKGLDLQTMETVTQLATQDIFPDLTVVLDISYEESMKRKSIDPSLQKLDRIESRGKEYHEKVRNAFLTMAIHEDRMQVVDAAQSKDKVHEEVLGHVFDAYQNLVEFWEDDIAMEKEENDGMKF